MILCRVFFNLVQLSRADQYYVNAFDTFIAVLFLSLSFLSPGLNFERLLTVKIIHIITCICKSCTAVPGALTHLYVYLCFIFVSFFSFLCPSLDLECKRALSTSSLVRLLKYWSKGKHIVKWFPFLRICFVFCFFCVSFIQGDVFGLRNHLWLA